MLEPQHLESGKQLELLCEKQVLIDLGVGEPASGYLSGYLSQRAGAFIDQWTAEISRLITPVDPWYLSSRY